MILEMITDKEIKQTAAREFPYDEDSMDYESKIDANIYRRGFEAGAKWALANVDLCHTSHDGFKVFKCATTCAGLPNCRLMNTCPQTRI